MKLYKGILIVGLFLTSIQWIKMTFAMAMLLKLNRTDLILEILNSYYLVMICVILCAGFLQLNDAISGRDDK